MSSTPVRGVSFDDMTNGTAGGNSSTNNNNNNNTTTSPGQTPPIQQVPGTTGETEDKDDDTVHSESHSSMDYVPGTPGYDQWQNQQNQNKPTTTKTPQDECRDKHGGWVADSKKCISMGEANTKELCNLFNWRGATFNEKASTCVVSKSIKAARNKDDCTNAGGTWDANSVTCFDAGGISTATTEQECTDANGVWQDDKCLKPNEVPSTEDSCEAGFWGFGWIFCPGQNLITELIDGMMGWIEGSMRWTVLADQDGNQANNIRTKWQNLLTIANIVFAIAFLVMIYSMATSTGLSNYDIKKMLPRLIVVAIAVNLSFYICAALVDLSNIVGAGMYSLIYGQASSGNAWNIVGNIANSLTNLVLLALSVFLFGGSVIIGIAIIVACLAIRQVLLVVLIIISPVAFALYMLPNTAKWAKKWFDMFARMLIIYPAFTAVWGGARLVSNIFATTGTSGIPGFIMDFVCAIAPAVAIIPLFKMSGSAVAMAAGAIAGSSLAKKTKGAVNGAGRHLATNNPITRKGTRAISNMAGQHGAKYMSSSNPFLRWTGRKAMGISNATGGHALSIDSEMQALDESAMNNAKLQAKQYSDNDLLTIAQTGKMPNGNDADQYMIRAADEAVGKSMSADQVKQMMITRAQEAENLRRQGRESDARVLLASAATAADNSGNWLGGKAALNNFKNGGWGQNAESAYRDAVINQAGNISKDALSKASAANLTHMQNELDSNPSAATDSAIAHLRNTAAEVQADPKAMGNMGAKEQSALAGFNNVRNTTERELDQMKNTMDQAQVKYDTAVNSNDQQAIANAQSKLVNVNNQFMQTVDRVTDPNTKLYDQLSPRYKKWFDGEANKRI